MKGTKAICLRLGLGCILTVGTGFTLRGQWAEEYSQIEIPWHPRESLHNATVIDLSQTPGISEFDAYTLWTYLRSMREIHSWYPLFDLPGYTPQKVEALRNRYSLRPKRFSVKSKFKIRGFYQTQISTAMDFRLRPERWGLAASFGDWEWGLALERDYLEPWLAEKKINHHTFYLQFKPHALPHWKFVLGDIQSRIGTGLSLQTEFSMTKLYEPLQVLRMGSSFRGYSGFLEQRAFRGLSAQWNTNALSLGVSAGWRKRTLINFGEINQKMVSTPKDPRAPGYNKALQHQASVFLEKSFAGGLWGVAYIHKSQPHFDPQAPMPFQDRLSLYFQYNKDGVYTQTEWMYSTQNQLAFTWQSLWTLPNQYTLGWVFTQRPHLEGLEDLGGFYLSKRSEETSLQTSLSSPFGIILNGRWGYSKGSQTLQTGILLPLGSLFNWSQLMEARITYSGILRSRIRWKPYSQISLYSIQAYHQNTWNHWWGVSVEPFAFNLWKTSGIFGFWTAPSAVLYRPKPRVGPGFPFAAVSGRGLEAGLILAHPKWGKVQVFCSQGENHNTEISMGIWIPWN